MGSRQQIAAILMYCVLLWAVIEFADLRFGRLLLVMAVVSAVLLVRISPGRDLLKTITFRKPALWVLVAISAGSTAVQLGNSLPQSLAVFFATLPVPAFLVEAGFRVLGVRDDDL